MRWLIRSFLFWLILAPLAWFFGVPYLLQYMDQKTQAQNSVACHEQVTASAANMPARRVDDYCACLNEALHFNRDDLIEMARTRAAPQRMNQALQKQVTDCNPILQGAAPKIQPVTNPDGSVEIHI